MCACAHSSTYIKAKIQKQPKRPQTDGCTKRDVCKYTTECRSAAENKTAPRAAARTPLGTVTPSGITQRDKCHTIITYTRNLNTTQVDRSTKRTQNHREQTGGCQGEEAEVSRCKLLYREWVSNKVLLHSTENGIQYSVKTHHGKNTHTHI